MAALVARVFHMDPLTVLDCHSFEWEVRWAATQAAIRQIREEV